jgi:hypothetical protein
MTLAEALARVAAAFYARRTTSFARCATTASRDEPGGDRLSMTAVAAWSVRVALMVEEGQPADPTTLPG